MKSILYALSFVGISYIFYLICRGTELAMGALERRADTTRASSTDAFIYRALYTLLHIFTAISFIFILPMAIYSFHAYIEDKAIRAVQSSSSAESPVSSAPSFAKAIFVVCVILLAFFGGYMLSSLQPRSDVQQQAAASSASSVLAKTEDSDLVYISKYGQCYHTSSSCGGMTGASRVTVREAKRLGRRPCEVCYK